MKRTLQTWWKTRRRTTNCVIVASREQEHDETDSIRIATGYWQEVFAQKPTVEEDMEYFMQFMPRLEVDSSCPSQDDFENCLLRVRSSAPGPDGIDYSA